MKRAKRFVDTRDPHSDGLTIQIHEMAGAVLIDRTDWDFLLAWLKTSGLELTETVKEFRYETKDKQRRGRPKKIVAGAQSDTGREQGGQADDAQTDVAVGAGVPIPVETVRGQDIIF